MGLRSQSGGGDGLAAERRGAEGARTRSEHDPDLWWSRADHFIHATRIERSFNDVIRRHVDGGVGMAGSRVQLDAEGKPEGSWDDIMKSVNAYTEKWAVENRGKPLDELVRIGSEVRGETLQLLSTLTDEQLADRIPGAPCTQVRCMSTGPSFAAARSRRRAARPSTGRTERACTSGQAGTRPCGAGSR